MSAHPVFWHTPQPLWARFGANVATAARAADQTRPVILRFATDEFMPQLLGTLARDPSRLDELIARPETWRTPAADPGDLIERTPIPRIAQTSLRTTRAQRLKGAVAATTHEASITEQTQTRQRPLKLYQPAHQRFYLVGASLICGVPGLPERAVVLGGAEEIKFVIRRLLAEPPSSSDPNDLREFAYVKDAAGARWQRVPDSADTTEFVAGEELLPVFPLAYQDDSARARTLWGGLVPVGRREEFISAAVDRSPAPKFSLGQLQSVTGVQQPAPALSKQARLTQFQMEVAEPWKNLIRASFTNSATLKESSSMKSDAGSENDADKQRRVFDFNLQQQNASWLILLDFADYLKAYLPDVSNVIDNDGAGAGSLPTPHRSALYNWLVAATMPAQLRNGMKSPMTIGSHNTGDEIRAPKATLRDALKAIRIQTVRDKLEATELSYTRDSASLDSADWPAFHFVLAGLGDDQLPSGPFASLDSLTSSLHTVDVASGSEVEADAVPAGGDVQDVMAKIDRLTAQVGRALEATTESDAPPLPFALQVRNALAANPGDAGWFVVRYVYTRTDCGPLHPPLLSAATQRFQLAAFFDPDAPARPIRISLPVDTSPAGLRKFNKNTALVMSDLLCGQVQRAKGLGLVDLVRSVLPWPLHKDLDVGSGGGCKKGDVSFGMICSLSIPIVTICALILLIIIVSILDYIFKWLPFFIMCFPLPNFKAKKATP
jgi:hypothetical protein